MSASAKTLLSARSAAVVGDFALFSSSKSSCVSFGALAAGLDTGLASSYSRLAFSKGLSSFIFSPFESRTTSRNGAISASYSASFSASDNTGPKAKSSTLLVGLA